MKNTSLKAKRVDGIGFHRLEQGGAIDLLGGGDDGFLHGAGKLSVFSLLGGRGLKLEELLITHDNLGVLCLK